MQTGADNIDRSGTREYCRYSQVDTNSQYNID